jgi:aerobic-type carbon monoxide dehydrogenase small subunit (CoxS/CutS family)
MSTTLQVNGREVDLDSASGATLLLALRNELGLKGTRFGCGEENCGACTVLVDGGLHYSCSLFVEDAAGKRVETIEGLQGPVADALRAGLVEAGAGQCGYCLSGIFVTAHELLSRPRRPGMAEVKQALSRNLCRCGAHGSILRGIARAIDIIAAGGGYGEA